jgi:hypothetical protein
LIKKKIDEKPRRWHEVLAESLWAYRTSKHRAIKVTPFELVQSEGCLAGRIEFAGKPGS